MLISKQSTQKGSSMSDTDKVFIVFALSNLFKDKKLTLQELKDKIIYNGLTISEFIEISIVKMWFCSEFNKLSTL